MKRPKFGSIYQRGNIYWIKYYKEGKPFYESSESTKYGDVYIVSERDLREATLRLNGYIRERESKRAGDTPVTIPEAGPVRKEEPTAGKLLN